jgi:SAM-dependent methyltransferase
MDLSLVLLKKARQECPEILLIRGDKRHIPGYFDVILSLFTSFGYFETDDEHVQTLEEIYRSLNSGGYFWLDFLNANYVRKNLVRKTDRELPDGINVTEIRWIENSFVFKKIIFSSKHYTKEYIERVRLYSMNELMEMLINTGFEIIHQFGNYKGKSWEITDERTILVARKKN